MPGQISFVTSIAPIALALGVPIEPLALLIAVETIPDIFRTLGNVTWMCARDRRAVRTDRYRNWIGAVGERALARTQRLAISRTASE